MTHKLSVKISLTMILLIALILVDIKLLFFSAGIGVLWVAVGKMSVHAEQVEIDGLLSTLVDHLQLSAFERYVRLAKNLGAVMNLLDNAFRYVQTAGES